MKLVVVLSALAVALLAGCSSMPGSASKEADEHAAHHPAGTVTAPAPAGYDQQMKMMQEMHQKMAAAKTPEERAALMKDHMKTMQDGMGMMGQMRGGMMGGKGMESGKDEMRMEPEMMKRRMDMMEVMMQMMMDREGMKPPATK
jgi:predicted lipoprotein